MPKTKKRDEQATAVRKGIGQTSADLSQEKPELTSDNQPQVKYELPQPEKTSAEEKTVPQPEEESRSTPTEESLVDSPLKVPAESGQEPQEPEGAFIEGEPTDQTVNVAAGEMAGIPETPDSITPQKESGGIKKLLFIGLIIIIVAGLVGGGIYVYQKAMKEANKPPETSETTPSPTSAAEKESEASPTPSPAAELKREDLKVQVLNGGGVPGAAGKAQAFLEGLGYLDVEVGNADNYDYEETEISIKVDKEEYLDLLLEDLESEYTVSSETATLDEASDFDAVITIGKE